MTMQVIPFTPRSGAARSAARPTEPAAIIIFPGVRYERPTEGEKADDTAQRDPRRDN